MKNNDLPLHDIYEAAFITEERAVAVADHIEKTISRQGKTYANLSVSRGTYPGGYIVTVSTTYDDLDVARGMLISILLDEAIVG